MFNNILVVCVGNICRSPMGEALLSEALKEHPVVVESAGIGALVGHEADPFARELMAERGLDISGHRARQLDAELVRGADLILVMETWHQKEIEKDYPFARGKVQRMGRWEECDIADPYRKPRDAFEEALAQIDRAVQSWKCKIWK